MGPRRMSTAVKAITRERSFAQEAEKLLLGDGDEFHGEAILAVTKALLQAGVSYVGGYPGAPVSHLMDVLADARKTVLEPYGIHFEQSASEAGAAAMLGASINYPLRGAVTWKSIVGTNVASDALSNLSSAGVKGGAVIVIGEDYGEGASVIQERTHATAMKSSMPLIDPRYDMPTIVDMTEHAFELSEASNLPVLLSLRIRACHMTGSFICKENRPAMRKRQNAPLEPNADYSKIVLPPSTYAQEKAKIEQRLPAARHYIMSNGLNETFTGNGGRLGIIMQGGTHGVVLRSLARLGLADAFGNSEIPLHVLNVIHPLVPEQITGFLEDKDSVLIIEEGHPAFIEEQIRSIVQQTGLVCAVYGKNVIPSSGEYITSVVRAGIATYLSAAGDKTTVAQVNKMNSAIETRVNTAKANKPSQPLPPRPPSFCTGCPERPIFSALKLIMRERGQLHVSMDIGCSTFATLPPFGIGNTVLGYGLSLASSGAISGSLDQPAIAVMGDGAFWHNGLSTGAINAQWQGMDAVLVILDNGYASATGQQHVPSTGATPIGEPIQLMIEQALRGIGVKWFRHVDSYNVRDTRAALEEALDARGQGLRVVMSSNECMLAKKRRGNVIKAKARNAGTPVRNARYGVDAEVCTGDHSCIRMSGCPSLTVKASPDPLKDGPTAYVDNNCAACNLCGENAHAAQLCPSFYKAKGTINPSAFQRLTAGINQSLLKMMGAS
jgi:indolepyruvate ferredoxin oxidoreductase, alpha subunit